MKDFFCYNLRGNIGLLASVCSVQMQGFYFFMRLYPQSLGQADRRGLLYLLDFLALEELA